MQKRSCVQCGDEFILQDSEIEFYESRNLNLPKRCKECRTKNKNSGDNYNRKYHHTNSNYHNNHYEKKNYNKSYNNGYKNSYNRSNTYKGQEVTSERPSTSSKVEPTKVESVTSQSNQNNTVTLKSKKNNLWQKIVVVIVVIVILLHILSKVMI